MDDATLPQDLFGRSILPGSATALERALDEAFAARADALPEAQTIPDALRAATTPVALLPWLAWERSVDQWEPDWSEATKRAAIAGAWDAHRGKGTDQSVEDAVALWGAERGVAATVSHGAAPFTYRLAIATGDSGFMRDDLAGLLRAVIIAKNVRSHIAAIGLRPSDRHAGLRVGARALSRIVTRVSNPPQFLTLRDPLHMGARARSTINTRLSI